ncbi:MAG: glycerophosphodiester phosphodiesterase [Porticoccaceae bacterium]
MLLVLLSSAFSSHAFELIAHRGNSCGATENSIEAVKDSWSLGASAIELDVRVSNDDIAYLYHDPSIQNQRLIDLAYSDILALSGTSAAPRLETILVLSEVNGYYLLDLKDVTTNHYQPIISAIQTANIAQTKIAFQSGDRKLLAKLKTELPGSRYFYLDKLKRKLPFYTRPKPESLSKRISSYGVDAISIKGRDFVDRKYIDQLKHSGLQVYVWTINSASRAEHYKHLGADGIITDNINGLKETLRDEVLPSSRCQTLAKAPPKPEAY